MSDFSAHMEEVERLRAQFSERNGRLTSELDDVRSRNLELEDELEGLNERLSEMEGERREAEARTAAEHASLLEEIRRVEREREAAHEELERQLERTRIAMQQQWQRFNDELDALRAERLAREARERAIAVVAEEEARRILSGLADTDTERLGLTGRRIAVLVSHAEARRALDTQIPSVALPMCVMAARSARELQIEAMAREAALRDRRWRIEERARELLALLRGEPGRGRPDARHLVRALVPRESRTLQRVVEEHVLAEAGRMTRTMESEYIGWRVERICAYLESEILMMRDALAEAARHESARRAWPARNAGMMKLFHGEVDLRDEPRASDSVDPKSDLLVQLRPAGTGLLILGWAASPRVVLVQPVPPETRVVGELSVPDAVQFLGMLEVRWSGIEQRAALPSWVPDIESPSDLHAVQETNR